MVLPFASLFPFIDLTPAPKLRHLRLSQLACTEQFTEAPKILQPSSPLPESRLAAFPLKALCAVGLRDSHAFQTLSSPRDFPLAP